MTEETRETCRRLFERACEEVYEPMFTPQGTPAPPWVPTPAAQPNDTVTVKHITPPQMMTMRKFCHYLFKNNQDTMLAIVQANREQRRKASDAAHPYLYRRSHDEAAVKALLKLASDKNITITGVFRQMVDSYSEYRTDYLNYKSCVKKDRKMNIPVTPTPAAPTPTPTAKAISTFVSDTKITQTIELAAKLTDLDVKKKRAQMEAMTAIKNIEAEQRELIRQMSKLST